MGQLIELAKYRTSKRRAYLKRYEAQLSKFISQFLDGHLRYSLEEIHYHSMSVRAQEQSEAWDYVDFRENLKEAFHEAFGQQLWAECQRYYWFDVRFLTKDDLIDRCISTMILGRDASVRGF